MINSGIYMIRHRDSGKCYIGRSTDIRNRWNLHKRHTEQNRDRSPLHRAMRKYGYDAFDWVVLVKAPARLHVVLEDRFMRDMGTMVPAGYNVGGAAGGQPSRELLDAMGPEERALKLTEMRELSAKMHATISELRKDPAYDAKYREIQSQSAKRRWAERKARIASDPTFAAKAAELWAIRAAKAASTIKRRRSEDADFSTHIRNVRSASGKKARANDPRTIAANLRKEVA